MKQEVKVEGMSCVGCANTVKERFTGLPQVEKVEIDLENKKAIIESTERMTDKELQTALEGTNYKVVQ